MKILGIGVDIIENKRIKLLSKNKQFIKRTFSKKEIISSQKFLDKKNFFAKRFAAKEALSKSIGIGFRNNLNLKILMINLENCYYYKSKRLIK